MENRTESNSVGMLIFIILFGLVFITALGFVGMIIAFTLMTPYIENFVLKPLSKKLSTKNYVPNNYMYRKLQNTRLVVWFVATILGFSLIFAVEMIAMAISVAKINEIKRKMGIPITPFSKQDYLIYEECSKFSEDDEYNEYEYEHEYENKNETEIVIEENEDSYDDVLNEEEPVVKEVQKFDFDKPVGELTNVEPIKVENSNIWDTPISGTDEIRCEKCGTIMSKMKIACPKCGTIVKNTYRTGK